MAKNDHLLPQDLLNHFKYEVAGELGITPQIQNDYWGGLTARDCGRVGGRIGGRMVRVMIRQAKERLSGGD
jgi:hypothetical protein